VAAGQEATFRSLSSSATASLAAGDTAGYLEQMTRGEDLLEEGHINRPFAQYHVARGHAMQGDSAAAVAALQRMLDEDVEALMIVYTAFDPAFAALRGTDEFQALLVEARATEIRVRHVRGAVWLLEGAGSQIVASIGPEGVLLVDTGYSLASAGIERALEEQDAGGIEYIINTHFHEDHVGGNANLGYYATIIAHPNTRAALQQDQEFIQGVSVPARGGAALPDLVSDQPLELFFNGDTVRVIPLRGHTTGDVVVYFSQSRVLHMGDRFFPDNMDFMLPAADIELFLETMDALMAAVPDDGVVVSGHAGVVPIARLREAYQGTAQMVEFVRAGREAGKSVGQLATEAEGRGYPTRWVGPIYQAIGGE
jgi:glyoxylase-like metal-dependent hydrolase (beta-lactamase superfamily II)